MQQTANIVAVRLLKTRSKSGGKKLNPFFLHKEPTSLRSVAQTVHEQLRFEGPANIEQSNQLYHGGEQPPKHLHPMSKSMRSSRDIAGIGNNSFHNYNFYSE